MSFMFSVCHKQNTCLGFDKIGDLIYIEDIVIGILYTKELP